MTEIAVAWCTSRVDNEYTPLLLVTPCTFRVSRQHIMQKSYTSPISHPGYYAITSVSCRVDARQTPLFLRCVRHVRAKGGGRVQLQFEPFSFGSKFLASALASVLASNFSSDLSLVVFPGLEKARLPHKITASVVIGMTSLRVDVVGAIPNQL